MAYKQNLEKRLFDGRSYRNGGERVRNLRDRIRVREIVEEIVEAGDIRPHNVSFAAQ